MDWDKNKSSSLAKKGNFNMGYAKIYIEKQVTYILRKVNGNDVTRVIYHQKNSSLPPKTGTKIYVTTRDHNKKTGHVTL